MNFDWDITVEAIIRAYKTCHDAYNTISLLIALIKNPEGNKNKNTTWVSMMSE